MFSYITLGTNDLPRATVSYDAVMAALLPATAAWNRSG